MTALTLKSNTDTQNFKLLTDIMSSQSFLNILNAENIKVEDSKNTFTDYKLLVNIINPVGNYSTNYSLNDRTFGALIKAFKIYKVALNDTDPQKKFIENLEKDYLTFSNYKFTLAALNFSRNLRTGKVTEDLDRAKNAIAVIADFLSAVRQSYKFEIYDLKVAPNSPDNVASAIKNKKKTKEKWYEGQGVFSEVWKSADVSLALVKAFNTFNKEGLSGIDLEIAKIELSSALFQGGATAFNLASGIMKTIIKLEDNIPYRLIKNGDALKSFFKRNGFGQVAEFGSVAGSILNLGSSAATVAILVNNLNAAQTDQERNYYIAELSIQSVQLAVAAAEIGYALLVFKYGSKYASSVAKGFGAVTAVLTMTATVLDIINLAAEFDAANKTRNELSIYGSKYGFSGFNTLADSLERTAMVNASFLAFQTAIAVVGIVGSFIPGVGVVAALIAGLGSLILSSLQQPLIEHTINGDRDSILSQYGSWSNYWSQSYAALRARYEDSPGFKAMINEYQSMIGDDGYGRVVLLSSMTPNDVQFQIAGRLREGASLQNQYFDATVVNKKGYTRNESLINATSATIDLSSSYLRQYVSLGPVLISPSEITAVRKESGKNQYLTEMQYARRTWNVVDGNTSTTVDLRGLALRDDGANTGNAATFDMGGGNDVLVMGIRKVEGDLGTGFNGVDYSTFNVNLNLNVEFYEDGWVSINKKGNSYILVEVINSRTTSVGKRSDTVQFLDTQTLYNYNNTTDWIKNVSYIEGGDGTDNFKGNSKQNFFIASAGDDVFDGGGGGDWIDYSNNGTSVKLALNIRLAKSYNLLQELKEDSPNGFAKASFSYRPQNTWSNTAMYEIFKADNYQYIAYDLNRDGISDIYSSDGHNFNLGFVNKSASLISRGFAVSSERNFYGDFNGDGVTDKVTVKTDLSTATDFKIEPWSTWSNVQLNTSDKLMVTNFFDKYIADFSIYNGSSVSVITRGAGYSVNFTQGNNLASFGDTDGNGKTEFIFADAAKLRFTYLNNNSNISTADWSTSIFNPTLTNIYTGDFNGDGKDDILRQEKGAWAADDSNMLSVYFSNGDYTFTKAETTSNGNAKGINPSSFHGDLTNLTVGDFNGDGFADILRTEKGAFAANGEIYNIVNIWLGDGKGGFKAASFDVNGNNMVNGQFLTTFNQTINNIQNIRGSLGIDTLVGDGQDNIIDGAGGSDKIYGLGGNDSFIAALSGNSFYDGGVGINFLDYGTMGTGANERISVSISSGRDGTVLKSSDNYGSRTDSFSLIQQIRGTDGNDTFMGGELDDQFFGQGGNDVFDTKAGDDIVVTGLGKDTVTLGVGNDKVYVQHDFASSNGVPLQTDTVDSVIGKGRYVYIRKNDGYNDYLVVAELQVMSNGVNVAQGKTSNLKYSGQSDDKQNAALNSVDGKTGGQNSDGMFCSSSLGGGWIQVDLGVSTSIDAIKVFGRTDSLLQSNPSYTVYVSDTDMANRSHTDLKAMANVGHYIQGEAVVLNTLSITSKLTTVASTSANFFRRDLNAGEKIIDGGEGKDTVSYVQNGTGMTTDVGIDADLSNEAQQTVKTWFQNGWTNTNSVTDKLKNIENIEGTQASDRILGSSAVNVLSGGDGSDWINGGAGDDVIYTGTGKDVVWGGEGDDKISVQHSTKPTARVGVGRYVYIRKNDGVNDHLSLAELQVMSNGVNVAQGKTGSLQFSGQYDAGLHAAANLVDGKTGGSVLTDGLFASSTAGAGWIQVDLGASTAIDAINIFGRTDGASSQNGQYTVYVSNTDMARKTHAEVKALPNVGYVNVANTVGWVTLQDPLKVTAGTVSTFTLPDANKVTNALAATGRYVYIRKNDDVTDYLSLAELQVMSNGVNVALGKTTNLKTSGQLDAGVHAAANLVDGKTGGNYAVDGIFASNTINRPRERVWIQVDLGASIAIDTINVFGRTDNGSSQNGKYTVYVSDIDMAGKTDFELTSMANVAFYNQSQVVTNTNIVAGAMTRTTGTSSNFLTRYLISDAKNIDGGAGNDVVSYKDSGPLGFGIEADLSRQTVKTGYGTGAVNTQSMTDTLTQSVTDTLTSIEGIEGTDWNDKLVGSDQDNKLYGAGGSDSIDGGAGDDELITGTGVDTVTGGSGDDVIRVQHNNPLVGKGRYVYIRKNDGVNEHLSLAELQVLSNGVNVAKGKTGNLQFSGQVSGHAAVNLVDGKTGGSYATDGIFASSSKGGGWIQVDLGLSFAIDAINVFGRTDTAFEQNGRYTLYVSDTDMAGKNDAELKAMANVGYYRENNVVSSSNLSVPLSATDGTSADFFNRSKHLVGTGRYVYIRKNDGVNDYLSLAELQVMSNGVNVAQGKTGNLQTSGQLNSSNCAATNLVDGKTGGSYATDGIFASSTAGGGWIQVDLGRSFAIDAINVFGRTDAWASQNGNYTVYVSDTDMAGKNDAYLKAMANVGYYRENNVVSSSNLSVPLSATDGTSADFFNRSKHLVGTGRYVYIRKNDGVNEHLTFAELQVMSNGVNVARGKTPNIKFSGQINDRPAVNVVDGKTGGDASTGGVFQSERPGGGWVQVDLGRSFAIDAINVFGRTDALAYQNGQYTVYVSDTDMARKNDAELKAMANVGYYRENNVVSSSYLSVPLSVTDGTSAHFFSTFSASADHKTIDGGEGNDTVSYKGMQDATGFGIAANLSTAQQTVGIWRDARNDTISSATLVGKGRYVYIRKNDGVTNYLSLAELQVMSNGQNVARGKTTNLKTSGQFDSGKRAASNLVDGKTGGVLETDGIFASATTSGGWIQVDLGTSTAIDAINIFGRTDAGVSQNGNYTVYVSDTDMSGKSDAVVKDMANVGYFRVDTQPTTLNLLNPLSVTNGTSMDFFFRDRVASSPTGGVVDNLSNIENIEGTDASDRLTGSNQNNKLSGLAGNDWIEGLDGSDYIETGTGFDKVFGGNGDDVIVVSHSRSKADWNLAATLSSTWSTLTGYGGVSDMDFLSSQFSMKRNNTDFKGELLQELKADTGVRTAWIGYFQANTGSKTEGTTYAVKLSFRDKSGGGVEVSVLGAKSIPIMAQKDQLDWETDARTTAVNNLSVTGLGMSALGFVDDYKIIIGGEGTDLVSYAKTILPPNVGIWADLSTAQQTVKTWAQGGTFASGSVVDNLSSIEGIEGTDGHDYLKGNEKINRLSGGAGNDSIDAGAGADIIATGTGVDTVLAGDGDDIIYVEHSRVQTNWTVSTALSSTPTAVAPIGNVNDLFLSLGTYGFTAGSTSFSNGRIFLKDTSQSGKAVVWVGSYHASSQRTYAVQIEFSDKVGGGVNAKVLSSKFFAGTEAAGASLDWNAGGVAPSTAYSVSSMSLSGMGYFNDAKSIAGGTGINTLDYSYSKTARPDHVGIFADLSAQKVDTWYQNATVMSGNIVDTLSGISNIGGTDAADKLMGNSADNEMAGYGGDDYLEGLAGNDRMSTGEGADTVMGGLGDDVVSVSHRRSVAKWDVNAFLSSSTSTAITTYGFVKDINVFDSKFTLYGSSYGNQKAGVLKVDKSVYGQITMWVGAFDGTSTLAVQIKLTDKLDAAGTKYVGGVDAIVLAAKSTLGDVTQTSFDWDTLGTSQSIASASGQAGLNVSVSNFVGAGLFDDAKNLQGGDGVDTVNYRAMSTTVGVGVDADLSTVAAQTVKTWYFDQKNHASTVTDTLKDFENLGGTDNDDKIKGSAAANKLWGYDGNDTINADGGDDVVITGTGADTVDAGAGDDAIFVEHTRPAAIAKGRYVLVRKEEGQATLNVTGLQVKSNGVNVASGITLTSSANNWYQVTLTQSVAIDEIALTFASDQTNVRYKVYVSDTDMKSISSVTNIMKTANIAYSQVLTALSSATITTTFLDTPGSADSSPVAARFIGSKSLNGGAGEDFLSYRQSEDNNPRPLNVGVNVDMTTYKINTWFENGVVNASSAVDTISNIENIGGTQYADRLKGNQYGNKLVGYEGNDTLDGGGGTDFLMGGEGSDTYNINAGFGTDVIYEDKSNTGDMDQVIFSSSINYADLWFQKSGADLMISQLGSTNVLSIRNWYSTDTKLSAPAKIESFKQGNNTLSITVSDKVKSLVDVMASYTKPSTTIAGSTTLTSSQKATINTAIASAWR
jgi:Ca2+-binding RTX toxin-like protein